MLPYGRDTPGWGRSNCGVSLNILSVRAKTQQREEVP